MKNRIITISREFGSGGRTIGKRVAQELGIPCYDSELLQKIAEESGFNENYIKEAGEYAPGGFFASAFSHHPSGPNNADYLWKIQFRVITELAEKGPCVIVGRCADSSSPDQPAQTMLTGSDAAAAVSPSAAGAAVSGACVSWAVVAPHAAKAKTIAKVRMMASAFFSFIVFPFLS